MNTFDGLWAKTFRESVATASGKFFFRTSGSYSIERHLLDTAGAAYALWDLWLRPELKTLIAASIAGGDAAQARNMVAAVAGLHDIGKASALFQTQPQSDDPFFGKVATDLREAGFDTTIPGRVELAGFEARRHEALSQAIFSGFPESLASLVGDGWVGAVIGGHHGRYHPNDSETCPAVGRALESLQAGKWGQAQTDLVQRVLTACDVTEEALRAPITDNEGVAIVLLTGLVILADWIASDGIDAAPLARRVAPATYVNRMRNRYARLMPKTVGIYRNPANPRLAVMGSHNVKLHPLQEAAGDVGRGLWIAAETTGSGKTEAAMLRHMSVPNESVLWGLPTRATADKMWDRIRHMYRGKRNIGALLHAHRSLNGFYFARGDYPRGLFYTDWAYKVLANIKPLLAPVAVGTVDQILLGALRQKWNPVRLLGVANAHVILDEAHTYDEYQQELLYDLMAWWGKTDTRVTVLSASLPRALVKKFSTAYYGSEPTFDGEITYPAHTIVRDGVAAVAPLETARKYELGIDLRTVVIPEASYPEAAMAAAAAETVLKLHQEHPRARIAVIMNRVDTTAEVGAILMLNGVLDVTVMHSRMAAGHRTETSEQLERIAGKKATTSGSVVIGTQVIEASLDLDFDLMVTELAPAASLIQRAGRLWRSSTPSDSGWVHPYRGNRPTDKPTLIVLAPSDEVTDKDTAETSVDINTPSERLALPYPVGALQRTKMSLPPLLRIPEDVQQLVDTAHYDSAEECTTDSAELSREVQRLVAARHVIIGAREPYGIFGPEVNYGHLRDLTEPDPLEESATRYSDYEQVTVLLLDHTGTHRWAWRGSAMKLATLATTTHREVSAILSKTIRVPAEYVGKYLKALEVPEEVKVFAASELRDVIPVVPVGGQAFYDEILGLRVRKAADSLLSSGLRYESAQAQYEAVPDDFYQFHGTVGIRPPRIIQHHADVDRA